MAPTWKGKRVLVTGGTGFIGSVMVEQLLEQGADVRVPIRAANYRALSRLRAHIEWVEGDLRSASYCSELLTGIDHVFHLASHRRNIEFHHDHCGDVLVGNVEMTAAMVRAVKDHKNVGVTFFSSANIPPAIDIIALAQSADMDGYVLGKAICETLWLVASRQYGFPLLIVRPVGVYGPRDTFSADSNVIPSLMLKARDNDVLDVWGSGKQERAFLYVGDLVRATFRLLEKKVQGIQYVVPPDISTIKELATHIRTIVKPRIKIRYDESKPEGKRLIPRLPNHASLRGFKWTPLKKGLQATYNGWLRRQEQTKG